MSEQIGSFKITINKAGCKTKVKGYIWKNGDSNTYSARVDDSRVRLFDSKEPEAAALKAITDYFYNLSPSSS